MSYRDGPRWQRARGANTWRWRSALAILSSLLLVQCGDDNPTSLVPPTVQDGISGAVQKGPFFSGMRVSVQELADDLKPAGRVYEVVTDNDRGEYRLESGVRSRYVEILATGSYFHESLGRNSSSLTLRALADVSEDPTVNVNALTTLEVERVRQLVATGDVAFEAAKRQAQDEILALIEFETIDMPDSDDLDITQGSEPHAILLTASLVIQGRSPATDVAQTLSRMQRALVDPRDDEIEAIRSTLRANASSLSLLSIRSRLESHYAETGVDLVVPPFEAYAKRHVPLEITQISPKDGAVDVSFRAPFIEVWFNQEMQPETFNAETFRISTSAGPVPGTVSYRESQQSAKFTPDAELEPGTLFDVSVATDVMTLAGNVLAEPRAWRFETETFDLSDGLVAHYPLDGDAQDASGNERHGTTVDALPASDRHGRANGALRLYVEYGSPTIVSSIQMPRAFPLTRQPWSYSIWLNLESVRFPTRAYLLANSAAWVGDDKQLIIEDDTRALYAFPNVTGSTVHSGIQIQPDIWYHVVLIYADGQITFYVDGMHRRTRSGVFTSEFDETTTWSIGRLPERGTVGAFQGLVDDVRMYDRVLNDFEIEALFEEGPP